jgi:hypothetical protein
MCEQVVSGTSQIDDGFLFAKKPAREKTMQERVIERLRKMASDERFDLMVKAGIYTRDGKLTPFYPG